MSEIEPGVRVMPDGRVGPMTMMSESESTSAASLLGGLSALAGQSFRTSADSIEAILKLIAAQLGMRTSYVSKISCQDEELLVIASFNAPGGCSVVPKSEFELSDTYCGTVATAVDPKPLIIEDCHHDPRFAGSRIEQAFPGIGSYLGVPIILSDGFVFGTLCAVDPEPHPITPEGAELVTVLARFCATEIERDVELTRRLAAEQEAARVHAETERSRGQLRAVLDAASDAMILVDPARRFSLVNRRFGELFDVEAATLLGQTFPERAAQIEEVFEEADSLLQHVEAALSDQERVLSIGVTQKAPVKRFLQLFSTPVDSADHEHLGRLFAFRDVTTEREVDRLKTEFVSLVSHELRTPLASIKGFVDLIFDLDSEGLTDNQLEFLTIIRDSVDRLVGIINDLLDISRIESGNLHLDWSEFDLKGAITEVTTTFHPQLTAKRQRLSIDVPDSLPLVLGDRSRVLQVLINLISNAHKYTLVGGAITVSARADERFITIDVIDTGIGMNAVELDRLFTKFFRAKNRATSDVVGTGLGLTITRSLVEAHGGRIDVMSSPGEGTTFRVTLPAAASVHRAPAEELPRVFSHDGRRVLVVEDDGDHARLIQRYLERGGYEVMHARTGTEAVSRILTHHPDLITLDMMLPDIDGFTVLERLRAALGNDDLPPVLVLSTIPSNLVGSQHGVAAQITKPIDETLLLRTVDELLHGPQTREIARIPAVVRS